MTPEEIDSLPAATWARGMTALRRPRMSRAAVVGFDTEFDSRTGELLSVQLTHRGASVFHIVPPGERLWPELLDSLVAQLLPAAEHVELSAFWALAELQHMPVWLEGCGFREYAGSFEADFRVGRRRLSIYDVARWYAGHGLARAAETIGRRKLDWARDRVSRRDLSKPAFREYAVRDAELAEALLNELRDSWLSRGVDPLIYRTPAGAAAAAFRVTLAEDVVPPEPRARRVALSAVWGGRAEALARGGWPELCEVDLDSAYPTALCSLERLPDGPDWRCSTTIPRSALGGFVRATFRHPDDVRFPVLPSFVEGRLIFLVQGTTFATIDEARLARRLGARVSIQECWYYTDGRRELPDYMGDLIRRRGTAAGTERHVLKLQANAIIGKLAQRRHRVGLETLRRQSDELGIPLDVLALLNSDELELFGIREPETAAGTWWPEVNGLVTGRTRATLGDALNRAPAPVYCATDSIWTVGPWNPGPGWSVKRIGPGDVYRTRVARILPAHVVHHGWHSRKAAAAAMDGGSTRYTIRRPVRARESLRTGQPLGRFVEAARVGTLEWCHKRSLSDDGSTQPHRDADAFIRAIRAG